MAPSNRRSKRLFIATILAFFMVASQLDHPTQWWKTREAGACSCGPNPDIIPTKLPTNTRLYFPGPRVDKLYINSTDPHYSLKLQKKGTSDGTVFETNSFRQDRAMTLTARKDLLPNTTYFLADTYKPKEPAWQFDTEQGPDNSPPTWNGVEKAKYIDNSERPLSPCIGGGGDDLELTLGSYQDNQTPHQHVLFAIWFSTGDARLDFQSPPKLITRARTDVPSNKPTITIGYGICDDLGHVLEPLGSHYQVGIRALDWAGNMSFPVEFGVKNKQITHPSNSKAQTISGLVVPNSDGTTRRGCNCSFPF
jgi:hypothetical protein